MNQFSKKVVIVGGGIAGLKAFDVLQSEIPSEEILLIEAQDRLGGRLYSTEISQSKLGIRYDLGASWFHDSLNNQTLNDLISENQLDVDSHTYYDDKDISVYSSSGHLDIVDSKLNRVIEDLEKFIELYYHQNLDVKDVSLREISMNFVSQYDKFLSPMQKDLVVRMIRYMELWFGISWDDISAKYSIMDHQGRNLLNKQTYSENLLKLAISKVPDSQVKLNEPVVKIHRTNPNGKKRCLVQTRSYRIECDYLIITVPLSKLQDESISWYPQLPANITKAFNSIHFGALGKVVFEFDSIWWDNTQDRFEIIPDHMETSASTLTDTPPLSFTYPVFAVNFSRVHNLNQGSLVILTQSPLTEYLESTTKENVWKYYKPMLSKLAITKMQDPINVITTRWTQNEYIKGSYTALHTNDDPTELIIQLSGEVDGPNIGLSEKYIRFAGEHTISDGAGCVHGAYNSGIREAKYILNDQ